MCNDQKETFPKKFSCPTLGFESPKVFQIFGSSQGLRSKPFPNWVIFKPCWKGLEKYYNTTKLSTKSHSLGARLVSFSIIVMWNEKFTKIIKDKLVYAPNLEQKLVWSPIPLLCCVYVKEIVWTFFYKFFCFSLYKFFLYSKFTLFFLQAQRHHSMEMWNKDKWKPCDILVNF